MKPTWFNFPISFSMSLAVVFFIDNSSLISDIHAMNFCFSREIVKFLELMTQPRIVFISSRVPSPSSFLRDKTGSLVMGSWLDSLLECVIQCVCVCVFVCLVCGFVGWLVC